MVSRDYMLEKPPGPSSAKLFLDQTLIPYAIDAAGACEAALQRLSRRTGVGVPVLLGGLSGVLAFAAWTWLRPAPVRRRTRLGW